MTAPELADVWVPVPLRWRHVQPGDVIVGADGHLWAIAWTRRKPSTGHVFARAERGEVEHLAHVDPDDVVNVLVPAPERDALTTTRDVLAARVIERRAG